MAWGAITGLSATAAKACHIPGIYPIGLRLDVSELTRQLKTHPELWDEFDLRTNHPESPHRELSDIFVRYNARENFTGDRHAFNERHDAVWWPSVQKLPAAKAIVFDLMRYVGATQLGMVLITRIPAGKQCYAHVDIGHHARFYQKIAVQISSAPDQAFYVEGDSFSAAPGEAYCFDNSRTHRVVNNSTEDRITMIVCMRLE